MMKVTLRFSSLFLGLILMSATAWAQPANDDCADAFEVVIGDSEANAVAVDGDTRGATASTLPASVCSGSWYTDDIWFKFTTPVDVPANGLVVRVYFNNATNPTDVSAIGMAIYESCGVDETPLRCFSSDVPEDNNLEIPGACLIGSNEYVVRVWSTGNTPATEGTLSVAVYDNSETAAPLFWETFAGGLEANGWTTEGTCSVADSNDNAGWTYRPDGLVDKGAYIFAGAAINSPTLCDGAVGVDSDYDDTGGIEGNFGGGPCPAPAQHILVSPAIYSGEWNAAGLSLAWNQGIRQFQSTYFFSYRTKDDADWSEWVDFQINTEFAVNGNFDNSNVQRHFMTGAAGHDSLQVRFVYNANFYMWIIDDVKIVETEANNIRVQDNFFSIAPWGTIPNDQTYPFGALADIRNVGASPQTNVVLNHTVVDSDSMEEVYNENLSYGTVDADTTIENKLNPVLIELPYGVDGTYIGTFTLTQDQEDFDPSDNVITTSYSVGGNTFGMEDGFTRSVAVANGVYDAGAPLSYAFGNYFHPMVDAEVDRIVWGVNNPDDMIDQTVQIYLLQWTDNNGDQIAQSNERKFIGYADYTFSGAEGDNAVLETTLDNFDNPGEPIIMNGGMGYIAIVEYQAATADDPQFFLLASEARDFGAVVLASDTAVAYGLADFPIYTAVLGHSPDGNISNIDYEVRELDVNDNRIFFGQDIVPLIRVVTKTTNTVDQLPLDNAISTFPNPASDVVQVKLEFSKPYSDVRLRLIDNLGRVVYYNELVNTITTHIEPITVSNMPAGNYLLQVETVDGQRSVPVIIVK
jgi:hypothetical protein